MLNNPKELIPCKTNQPTNQPTNLTIKLCSKMLCSFEMNRATLIQIIEVFVEYLTNVRVWHMSVFKRVQSHGRSSDTPSGHKNASGPVGIPLKTQLWRQTINLATQRWVTAWGESPPQVWVRGEPRLLGFPVAVAMIP